MLTPGLRLAPEALFFSRVDCLRLHCHTKFVSQTLRDQGTRRLLPRSPHPLLDSESSVPLRLSHSTSTRYAISTCAMCRLRIYLSIPSAIDRPPTSRRVPTITTTRNRLSITKIKKKSFRRLSSGSVEKVGKIKHIWRICLCRIHHADWCVIAKNTDFWAVTTVFASFKQLFQPLAPRVPEMYIVTQWGLLCCWCYSQYRDV